MQIFGRGITVRVGQICFPSLILHWRNVMKRKAGCGFYIIQILLMRVHSKPIVIYVVAFEECWSAAVRHWRKRISCWLLDNYLRCRWQEERPERNSKAFAGGSVTLPYKRWFCVGERNAECKIVCHCEPQRGVAITRGRSPTCVWSWQLMVDSSKCLLT